MTHIIDYIGADGITHTPMDDRRFLARVGDVMQTPEGDWRIASITFPEGQKYKCDKEYEIVAVRHGSFFWLSADSASVSGGPFHPIKTKLEWMYQYKRVNFWNWGNLGPGAGNGVYYHVDRPVWHICDPDSLELLNNCTILKGN